MKFAFTLLIIFAGLNLSAASKFKDTLKGDDNNSRDISAKASPSKSKANVSQSNHVFAYGIKLPYYPSHADSIEAQAISNTHIYGLTLLTLPSHSEGLIIPSALKVQPDYIVSSLSLPDSVLIAAARFTDSLLKANVNLKRLDSLNMLEAAHVDSLKKQLKFMGLDSLQLELKANNYQSLKGPLYSEIAARYLAYDTITSKKQRVNYQNQALNYTMLALHQFSAYNDTTGLRISFDGLAKVYFSQKKYSQAKWFILQSNSLSRAKNDVPNIISSLLTLSSIKSAINDYGLAMGDLNEALKLSEANHLQKTELDVLKNYAMLYSMLKNYPKEASVIKKRDSLVAAMHKDEETKLMAVAREQSILQKKKQDAIQNKKKVYTSNIRKLSAKRIASL